MVHRRFSHAITIIARVLIAIVVLSAASGICRGGQSAGATTEFVPECNAVPTCLAWADFRKTHPYPYQTFAAKQLPNGSIVVVLSEPPPLLSKRAVEKLVKLTFGSDLISAQRLRWKIGIDGWVEDLVLNVKPLASEDRITPDVLFADNLFRDRIALLHLALFGTTYGGQIEMVSNATVSSGKSEALNLRVSARELSEWVAEPSLSWISLDARDSKDLTWKEIVTEKRSGAFASSDGSLVMLTVPTAQLLQAQKDRSAIDFLRADFRRFAVDSDVVLGGVWTASGQTAIVGRSRTHAMETLPPLRFETFQLLAAESDDELHQSYERNNVLAGKIRSGPNRDKDWAPILLSASLIDTELGALLNITDQMLKGWSEAGHIEYTYFAYPMTPSKFPFEQPLSNIVFKKTGSSQLLYNWNTSGSAVLVKGNGVSVLVGNQTGALPVTYGSELEPNSDVETGHLVEYEDTAYEYFTSVRDPNLSRVAQYTVVYQLFRAVMKATLSGEQDPDGWSPVEARVKATDLLVAETKTLLDRLRTLDAEKFEVLLSGYSEEKGAEAAYALYMAKEELAEFRGEHPKIDDNELARLLVDPRAAQSTLAPYRVQLEMVPAAVKDRLATLVKDTRQHSEEREQVANEIEKWIVGHGDSLPDDLSQEGLLSQLPIALREKIDRLEEQEEPLQKRQQALKEDPSAAPLFEILAYRSLLSSTNELSRLLNDVAPIISDLSTVCQQYVNLNADDPPSWIKTPSVVLSWDREDQDAVGGHNLDSHVFRIEMAPEVADIALVETKEGFVLKYNPTKHDAVSARAGDLARAVEHRQVEDVKRLAQIVDEPVAARSRLAALEMQSGAKSQNGKRWAAQLGTRVYAEKKPFVEALRAMAEKNGCCAFAARDRNGFTYIAEQNSKPPPSVRVVEARDTPSVSMYVREASAKRSSPIVFLDESPDHLRAVTMNLRTEDDGKRLENLASELGNRPPRDLASSVPVSISYSDVEGRASSLEAREVTGNVRDRGFFSRVAHWMGVVPSKQAWRQANVDVLDQTAVEAFVRRAGWEADRDGTPTAVVISFDEPGLSGTQSLHVVAGFDREQFQHGQDSLRAINQQSLNLAAERGAGILQYFMTVKNELRAQSAVRLKRLVFVVGEGETETVFAHRESPKEGRSGKENG